MRDAQNVKVAGIHLAGPNSLKTILVIMTGHLGEGNLKIDSVYDRVGPLHKLFSDDRLFEILRKERPDRIMIDSPLTVPPCVACTRASCPGVIACEDIAVAYMQKMLESSQGRRRKRPLNPQTQRIWDVKEWFESPTPLQEPTYSANRAPLVVRAMTLQRRLNSLDVPLNLFETSIPHALVALVEQLSLDSSLAYEYRAFEVGHERRAEWLHILQSHSFLHQQQSSAYTGLVIPSAETFSALIAAMIAYWQLEGKTPEPDNEFFIRQGWIYLPKLNESRS